MQRNCCPSNEIKLNLKCASKVYFLFASLCFYETQRMKRGCRCFQVSSVLTVRNFNIWVCPLMDELWSAY